MKRLLLFFSILPASLTAQYHFSFESGIPVSWEQLPENRWDVTDMLPISEKNSLQHQYDNTGSGCDYLIFRHDPVSLADTLSLAFRIRHGYPPSSANNWQVILLAGMDGDLSSDKGISDGIVMGVNYKGTDDLVKIWQCEEGQSEVLCATTLNYQEIVGTRKAPLFRLEIYPDGWIHLLFSEDPEFEAVEIGSCKPDIMPTGRVLLFRYEYTSSQDRNLWLDDVMLDGVFNTDRRAPEVLGVTVSEPGVLMVELSEPVVAPARSDFHLNYTVFPDSVSAEGNMIFLRFSTPVENRKAQTLWVSRLCDPDGNCLSDTTLSFIRNDAVWGDVVIHEIMADPSPQVYLPVCEYLEVVNRSAWEADLSGWHISVNSRSHSINHMKLEPGRFGLLLPMECGTYLYGEQDRIFTSSSALPNEGAIVSLYNQNGVLIHIARYGRPDTEMEWKEEGGWSLESPNHELFCLTSDRWVYSESGSGGTPGEPNSVNIYISDQDPPQFLYWGFNEESDLILKFSELIRFPLPDQERLILQPGDHRPDTIFPGEPFFDHLVVRFRDQPDLSLNGELVIPSVSDCEGNRSGELRIPLGAVSRPVHGSVVLNEVMYDPLEGIPEFIELRNPGNYFFDLKDLNLSVVKEGAAVSGLLALSENSRILPPGAFVVISNGILTVRNEYGIMNMGTLVEPDKLTQLENSGGTIYLTDRSGQVVDVMDYGDSMHMEMLHDTKGISLERISAERSGRDPGNWHSAASVDGYATPGKKNSQSAQETESDNLLELTPKVFSPDNDGYEDLLQITVSPGYQGVVIRIRITDLFGNVIRSLANNHISGTTSTYIWDGESDQGVMAETGIYVVHLTGYDSLQGRSWSRKLSCGLIYR